MERFSGVARIVDDSRIYDKDEQEHLANVRVFLPRYGERKIRLNESKMGIKSRKLNSPVRSSTRTDII